MIGERCEGMDTFKIVKQDSLFWFTCILNVDFFLLISSFIDNFALSQKWLVTTYSYVFQKQTYVRFEQIEEIFIGVLSYCIAFPLNEFGIIIF